MYAQIKSLVFGAVPTGWDATQILIGYAVFLIVLLAFRRPIRTWWAVLPVGIIGLAIEVADMALLGQGLATAVRDLVLFAILPLVTVTIYRMGWAK